MARRKQFVEEDVVERAMEAFWLHGYEGIGLTELLEEMGISRQSLYDTFGSKRDLFIRCIEYYRANHLSGALSLLERDRSGLENVRAVMNFFAELALDKRCRGCLVANALVELGPHDEEISTLLEETLALLQGRIQRALEVAQAEGQLSADRSPRDLSQALTNAMIGMAVTGKIRQSEEAVRAAHAGTLALLG